MTARQCASHLDFRRWLPVVGGIIRDKRKSFQLTQSRLSRLAGLSRTTLVMIERGSQGISLEQLFALASVLNCHITDLLPGRLAPRGSHTY
jgi:transcriptional regulator with XRE-family HTH domain